jgi:FAD/FMN-containing dehydrogenase
MATKAHASIDQRSMDEFRSTLRGELVGPDDDGYDARRRVWNASIDRYPAVIARCAGVADVISAVRFARTNQLLVAVRGGGHSYPGYGVCDGGIVIDLSLMKGVRVDPERRTVRAQAGLLLGDLDRETQAFGSAVPAGFISHTGMAGLTLGGGIGFTMRRWGLTIDNLLSVDVITAEGEFVKASREENADLFWGLRGGGGNFGIATEFEFRLNPIGPEIYAGPIFWPIQEAPRVLRFYRDWIADCPDELTTLVTVRRAPATVPGLPTDLVGRPVIAITSVYAGSVDDGERFVRPLKHVGSPALDRCAPMSYLTLQQLFNPSFPPGWWYYFRSCDVAELNDDIIDVMIRHAEQIESPITAVGVWQGGGAVARVGEDETAFHGRNAGHTFNIGGNSTSAAGFEQERAWVRRFWTALQPYHTSVYVNFLMDEGQERIRQAYGAAKYARLRALKQKYDPTNFFRLNQNIPPAGHHGG